MILCKKCAFELDGKCRLYPPQMKTHFVSPDDQFAPADKRAAGFYVSHTAEYPSVSDEGHGCFQGKLTGTYQQELL